MDQTFLLALYWESLKKKKKKIRFTFLLLKYSSLNTFFLKTNHSATIHQQLLAWILFPATLKLEKLPPPPRLCQQLHKYWRELTDLLSVPRSLFSFVIFAQQTPFPSPSSVCLLFQHCPSDGKLKSMERFLVCVSLIGWCVSRRKTDDVRPRLRWKRELFSLSVSLRLAVASAGLSSNWRCHGNVGCENATLRPAPLFSVYLCSGGEVDTVLLKGKAGNAGKKFAPHTLWQPPPVLLYPGYQHLLLCPHLSGPPSLLPPQPC